MTNVVIAESARWRLVDDEYESLGITAPVGYSPMIAQEHKLNKEYMSDKT